MESATASNCDIYLTDPLPTKQGSLTLVATGAKLAAYAPGRMKAATNERARHLRLTEPVFRLFGVPESPKPPREP
jgi:hypothetical protein